MRPRIGIYLNVIADFTGFFRGSQPGTAGVAAVIRITPSELRFLCHLPGGRTNNADSQYRQITTSNIFSELVQCANICNLKYNEFNVKDIPFIQNEVINS